MGFLKSLWEGYKKMFGYGADYWQRTLGLNEGENPTKLWYGMYDVDISTGHKIAGALIGVHYRPKRLYIALTTRNRLSIVEMEEAENPPWILEKGHKPSLQEVTDREAKEEMYGADGSKESGKCVEITCQGETVRILIGASGAEELLAWAKN